MKKLTQNQMRDLKVYNVHYFAGQTPHLVAVPYDKCSLMTFGWWLYQGGSRERFSSWGSGAQKNWALKDLAKKHPAFEGVEWVPILGGYVPKPFYEKRMAELVEQYKALKAKVTE